MSILKFKDENGEWQEVKALQGPPGPVPEKGVDYFTDEDKSELVSDVLAALPTWEGGSY